MITPTSRVFLSDVPTTNDDVVPEKTACANLNLEASLHSDIISLLLDDPVSASLSLIESEEKGESHITSGNGRQDYKAKACTNGCLDNDTKEDEVDIVSLSRTAQRTSETERHVISKSPLLTINFSKQNSFVDSPRQTLGGSAQESLDSSINTGSWVFENNIAYVGTGDAGELPLRTPRGIQGTALSNFSRLSFWIVACCVFLVTVPILVCLLLLLESEDAYITECHPRSTLSIVLVVVCGFLHFTILIVYISQVLKHREHPALKVRGHFFLWQICTLAPFVPIVCTLNSLGFLGVLSGDCIFTFGGIGGESNLWTWKSNYVLISTQAAIRFFSIMFFAAIIARQRTVYLLFVKHADEFRTYTRKRLLKQYMYPNVICLLVWFITEAVYQVCTCLLRYGQTDFGTTAEFSSAISMIGILERALSTLAIVIAFSYYAFETRNVEVFSDWSANARTIAMFSIGTVIQGVFKLVTGAILWSGFLNGALVMSLVTMYFLDSFTAALIDIHVGLNEQNWANRGNLDTTVIIENANVK
ncbi:hypothetical protein SARC_06603 [Sphaeroforma arctica JP610]|uniref:Uncharacterized protein n=1 Tax=Sphaeroforma arctica JP610 TaxID=667725 RepID=A0A0L0FX00_9EUKA|nr:hypothetical protein SARC_06603 [Sphaeroforma arctica JP610]KNC81061.1 hypothetical protein SARC_06603 [Sphaeroforma arctica JP610]|eukprot:XP_014154963.1 hypothetical protein SARC_06603 [Sphaeroforma arctica JP610]